MIHSKNGIINLSFDVARGVTNPRILYGVSGSSKLLAVVGEEQYEDWKDGREFKPTAVFSEDLTPMDVPEEVAWTDTVERDDKLVFDPESKLVNYLYSTSDAASFDIWVPWKLGLLHATRLRVSAIGLEQDVAENSMALIEAVSGALSVLFPRVDWPDEQGDPQLASPRITSSDTVGTKTFNGCECTYSNQGMQNGYFPLSRFKSQFKTSSVMVFVDVSFEVETVPSNSPHRPAAVKVTGYLHFDARKGKPYIDAYVWTWNRLGELYFCCNEGEGEAPSWPNFNAETQTNYAIMKLGSSDQFN